MTTPTELEYFTVNGYFFDVQQPLAGGTTGTPQFSVMSGFVTFTPRLPTTIYVANLDTGTGGHDTALAVTPIVGQIISGELCSIDIPDTPGVQLLSNTANLGLAALNISDLVYDVAFSSIVYAHEGFTLSNFAFVAPTDTTPVDLTDPALTRLPPLSGALASFTVESVFGPVKLVDGVPTDGDFLTVPANGTLACNTQNTRLYIRIGGVWVYT